MRLGGRCISCSGLVDSLVCVMNYDDELIQGSVSMCGAGLLSSYCPFSIMYVFCFELFSVLTFS